METTIATFSPEEMADKFDLPLHAIYVALNTPLPVNYSTLSRDQIEAKIWSNNNSMSYSHEETAAINRRLLELSEQELEVVITYEEVRRMYRNIPKGFVSLQKTAFLKLITLCPSADSIKEFFESAENLGYEVFNVAFEKYLSLCTTIDALNELYCICADADHRRRVLSKLVYLCTEPQQVIDIFLNYHDDLNSEEGYVALREVATMLGSSERKQTKRSV